METLVLPSGLGIALRQGYASCDPITCCLSGMKSCDRQTLPLWISVYIRGTKDSQCFIHEDMSFSDLERHIVLALLCFWLCRLSVSRLLSIGCWEPNVTGASPAGTLPSLHLMATNVAAEAEEGELENWDSSPRKICTKKHCSLSKEDRRDWWWWPWPYTYNVNFVGKKVFNQDIWIEAIFVCLDEEKDQAVQIPHHCGLLNCFKALLISFLKR